MKIRCSVLLFSLLLAPTARNAWSQLVPLVPEGAHVNLYFPQLADGGTDVQSWQSTFLFFNPSDTFTAHITLYLYADSGSPLSLDLGLGGNSQHAFSIPPLGVKMLRSRIASRTTVTGWAMAFSDTPVQGTVLFRALQKGTPQFEISALATLPTVLYRSTATRELGIAVANQFTLSPVSLTLRVLDSRGALIGGQPITLAPLSHRAFNLYQLFPNLPDGFIGSIELRGADLASDYFVAWTLNGESGVVASLPPGPISWPLSHWDRLWLVFLRILNTARDLAKGQGIDLSTPPVTFKIEYDSVINARATRADSTVHVTSALSELISDSPSEMAFIIAHELAHIVQYRRNSSTYVFGNPEIDADQFAVLFCLAAGFDPYAGAGALAKIAMASGQAGLVAQLFDDLTDIHTSINTGLAIMFDVLKAVCSDPQIKDFCAQYKSIVHPSFPSGTPLFSPQPPVRSVRE